MMFSPAVRTSAIPDCSLGSKTSTTPPQLAPALSQASPRAPSKSPRRLRRRRFSSQSSSANSTKRIASGSPRKNASTVGLNMAISRAKPNMVRSVNSTAIGPSLTMCGAAAKQRRKLQFDGGREGERALRSDQEVRQVDVVARRQQGVEIVAADAALH